MSVQIHSRWCNAEHTHLQSSVDRLPELDDIRDGRSQEVNAVLGSTGRRVTQAARAVWFAQINVPFVDGIFIGSRKEALSRHLWAELVERPDE